MKKRLFIFAVSLVMLGGTLSGRDNVLSHLATNVSSRSATVENKTSDTSFEAISRKYSNGLIPSDTLVSLALYHKSANPVLAEKYLNLAASNGDLRGIMELGSLYVFSPGYANKEEEGLRLLQKAAEAGYEGANDYLGMYYFQHKDYKKAKSYFDARKSSHYGFAHTALGSMYLEGKGVSEDGAKAREHYHHAAQQGYSRGMSLYANLLGTKNGGSLNYPDAFFWHYIAGELGENYSRVMLYRPRLPEKRVDNEVVKDAQMALQWIEMVHSGKKLSNEPIYKKGFLLGLKNCEKEAEAGDDWSRFYLGSMNYNGDFLNQNYARALYYFEPIARNGKLPAPILAVVHQRLADMYRNGKGTAPDASKADSHVHQAARYGSAQAYEAVEH